MAQGNGQFRYEEIQTLLAQEIASLQNKDVLYWQPIIDELRVLRSDRILLKQGTPVVHLL